MILPFSVMDYAEAIDEETIKLTEKGKRLIDRIENKLANDGISEQKREKLEAKLEKVKAKLEPILETLNNAGLYTPEQFKEVRDDLVKPNIPSPTVSAFSCSSDCDPVVFFRPGYDWQILGFWQGTEVEPHYWKITQTGGVSDTDKEPHNTDILDWIIPFTQIFCDGGTSAQVSWDMGTPFVPRGYE